MKYSNIKTSENALIAAVIAELYFYRGNVGGVGYGEIWCNDCEVNISSIKVTRIYRRV